jgi:FkbM family methyltransferase
MKNILKNVLGKFGFKLERHYDLQQSPRQVSYSQCGEDILIDYVFRLRGIEKPTYIDIGANHPVALNNTFKFYKKGSRGINIEPNSFLAEKFKIIRPGDTTLSIGISSVEGSFTFYVFEDHRFNTFDKKEAENYIVLGHKPLEERKVNTYTVESVLAKYHNNTFPDLLSVDVEGLDLEIIKSIDFKKYYPKVVCIETAEYSPIGAGEKKLDIMKYIESQQYTLYADTNLNSIYVKNEFWFL